MARKIAQFINASGASIVQANAGDTLKYLALSKFFFGWKAKLVFRNANKSSDFIQGFWKKALYSFFVKQVNQVISVSQQCEEDFQQLFAYPKAKITTITNGVDLKPIDPMPQDLEYIFAQGPVIAHVGSFVPEKNHAGLLRIFQQVLHTNPKVQLLLLGTGSLMSATQQMVKEMGMSDKVHFLGARKDVLAILSQAKALCMPSWIEGLPGAILEAQYAQCPVIAYDVGGISEVIKDGKTGYLVRKGDESAFVEKVNQVLEHTAKVEAIKASAYQQVIERFDNRTITQAFAQVYLKLTAC